MREKFWRNVRVLTVTLLLSAVGCLLGNQLAIYKKRPIKFSHKVHIEKAELGCEECHTKASESEEAGMPSLRACQLCHDSEDDQAQKLKPFLVEGKPLWTEVTKIPAEVKFSHQTHLDKEVKCEECHQGIKDSEAVSEKLRVRMDDCLKCHSQKKVKADCAVCHTEVSKSWKPGSHSNNWDKIHGQVSRAKVVPPMENNCALCHTQTTCATCHQNNPPRNHNSFWRQRSHGIAAEMDRENCSACHRTDYCDRCHRETPPRSHIAGWGEPRDRHCLVCHFPLQSQNCAMCHKEMEGHLEAPEMPDGITHRTADKNACLYCHRGRIPHPVSGDNCRICHK